MIFPTGLGELIQESWNRYNPLAKRPPSVPPTMRMVTPPMELPEAIKIRKLSEALQQAAEATTPARTVGQAMSAPVTTIDPEATVAVALELMASQRIRHLPVVREDTLLGIVSDRDLLAVHASPLVLEANRSVRVGQIMTRAPRTVTPCTDLRIAAAAMLGARVHCLLVTWEDRLLGILTSSDLVRALGG